MAEHKLGHGDCPACQETGFRLTQRVARLEGEIVGYKNDLQNVREMLEGAQATNAALAAALRAALNILKHAGLHDGPESDDWLAAALSDTQTGTAGEGGPPVPSDTIPVRAMVTVTDYVPPPPPEGWLEVREQVRKALEGLLRDMHTGTSTSNRGSFHHSGLGCGRPCETCNKARAALGALEVT